MKINNKYKVISSTPRMYLELLENKDKGKT